MAVTAAKRPGPLAPIEDFVMPIASQIPLSQAKAWLSAYFHPAETFDANKSAANFGAVVVHLLLIGVVAALAGVISSLLSLNFVAAIASLLGLVIVPIVLVIGAFIGSVLLFVLAKILGGKGGFMEQTLGLALIYGGYVVLAFPFTALSGLPFVGFLFGLVTSLISLYNIYNEYLMMKRVHQLSSTRAALLIIIPIIIIVVLVLVAAAALVAMLGVAGLGASALGGAAKPY